MTRRIITLRSTGRDLVRDLSRSLAVLDGERDPMLPTDEQLDAIHEQLESLEVARVARVWGLA